MKESLLEKVGEKTHTQTHTKKRKEKSFRNLHSAKRNLRKLLSRQKDSNCDMHEGLIEGR
jgi:hypothetical protein